MILEESDYEIYKYIDKQAEAYIPLDTLLSQNKLTYQKALQQIAAFQSHWDALLQAHNLPQKNIVQTSFSIMEQLSQHPKDATLQYIYLCIVTDCGILNRINAEHQTTEQNIRNYLRQRDLLQELTEDFRLQMENMEKFQQIRNDTSKTAPGAIDRSEEAENLYEIAQQYDHLKSEKPNQIFQDNLNALLMHIEANEQYRWMQPYLLHCALTRKAGMMCRRESFLPNIRTFFQYQPYNIDHDNGKNFNSYLDNVALYMNLREEYAEEKDIDLALCDFCFANLSPLSEWYYLNCHIDADVPRIISRKICQCMPLNFPILYPDTAYIDKDLEDFRLHHRSIYRQWKHTLSEDLIQNFLQAIAQESEIAPLCSLLPDYDKYPRYAEVFLYQNAEITLREMLLDIPMKMIKL